MVIVWGTHSSNDIKNINDQWLMVDRLWLLTINHQPNKLLLHLDPETSSGGRYAESDQG
jgi:hypothetical protein